MQDTSKHVLLIDMVSLDFAEVIRLFDGGDTFTERSCGIIIEY